MSSYKRIPRKKKKKIPVGMYCYTSKSELKKLDNGWFGFLIEACPFYTRKKEIDEEDGEEYFHGWCKLVKRDVLDQCKSCGLKYGF